MHRQSLPQSHEAEQAVLGAGLIDGECFKTVTGHLDGSDFYSERHRLLFHAMVELQNAGRPIDIITLTTALKSTGNLEAAGGAVYLAELIDITTMSANVAYYCKAVKEVANRRRLIELGQRVIAASHGPGSLDELLTEAKEDLFELTASMDTFGGVSANDILTVDQRAERYMRQVKTLEQHRFTTGYYQLDKRIRGVAPGEVLTIIAEPGGFKTAFLQNILQRGAERTGLYHLFFSLEMPVEKVFEREAQISSGHIGAAVEQIYRAAKDNAQDLQAGLYKRGARGFLVCDKPRLDLAKIGRYIDLATRKFGRINAVGIDYLGLLASPGRTLFEKTQQVAPEIKHLAKEFGLPIILLCQINREGAKSPHDILITDAKGGGDIEASADIMLGLYHDAEGRLICKGLKNRNGGTGWRLEARINREAFQFLDMVEYENREPVAKKRPLAVERWRSDLPI